MHQMHAMHVIALIAWVGQTPSCNAFHAPFRIQHHRNHIYSSTRAQSSTINDIVSTTGKRIPINENLPGIEKIYSNPDIFIIKRFLSNEACDDIIAKAEEKTLQLSPVAYAGWTQDVVELLGLAAKGPVAWGAIIGAWLQVKDSPAEDATQIQLVLHALQNYVGLFVLAAIAILAFTKNRADNLQSLRTSTSTTLDNLDDAKSGTFQFVTRAAELFGGQDVAQDSSNWKQKEAKYFEAPTVIRYEKGQSLAPHYDANRNAATEDSNRGGQTLATLIVYLNDVKEGGNTRFGKLSPTSASSYDSSSTSSTSLEQKGLTVQAEKGSALLFFPADNNGMCDDRLEHEGCEAVDEKWVSSLADRLVYSV